MSNTKQTMTERGTQYLSEIAASGDKLSMKELADKHKVSLPMVYNCIKLAQAPAELREMIAKGRVRETTVLTVLTDLNREHKEAGTKPNSKDKLKAVRERITADEARKGQLSELSEGGEVVGTRLTQNRKLDIILKRVQDGQLKGTKATLVKQFLTKVSSTDNIDEIVEFFSEENKAAKVA